MSFDNPEKIQKLTRYRADYRNSTHMTYDNKYCIRRCFNDKPHGPDTLKKLLNLEPKNFTVFEEYVRIDYHNGMHNHIGEGTLNITYIVLIVTKTPFTLRFLPAFMIQCRSTIPKRYKSRHHS